MFSPQLDEEGWSEEEIQRQAKLAEERARLEEVSERAPIL
jgi:hypothetical protein